MADSRADDKALIGRDGEQRRIESFLDAADRGPHALVLHGEAGIGKTALWNAGLDIATRRGYRVLTTRPTEAEARLPFAGLHDLFADLVDLGRSALPPPQLAALEIAFMRADGAGEPMQPLALSLAVLELVRLSATDQPLVIGIDDVQWLDESSAAIVRFVVRRLEHERVAIIVTERTSEAAPLPTIVTDLPADRIGHIELTALTTEVIDRLLDESLGLRLAPTMLRNVHRMSGGNPFYALEVGRALQAVGGDRASGTVPLPESLTGLLRQRLAALPPDASNVVVHAAALTQPTTPLLEAALGVERARRGIVAAREASVLATAEKDPIRFSHPMLAAEAYARIEPAARAELHRRLAAVVTEPEELARHLALATTGPDAAVAEALDAAAAHAAARGAPDAAAELFELAAGLTAEVDGARAHRMAIAGRHRLMAGDLGRARELLERALDEPIAERGQPRAELLVALAHVRQLMDDFSAAAELGEEALRHVGDDGPLTVEIRLLLAGVSFVTGTGWKAGARHAAEAMRLAEGLGDARIVAGTIGHHAAWRYATGHRQDPDLERRVADLEPHTRHLRTLDHPAYDLAGIRLQEGDVEAASVATRALLERAERDGDYSSLPFLLATAALADFLDGRADLARQHLDRAERLSTATHQAAARVHALVVLARLESRLGDADAALAAAEEAFEVMAATGWGMGEWWMRTDLALLELSRDDPVAALRFVADAADPNTIDEAGRHILGRAAAVDALVALGRPDDAIPALEALEARARAQSSPRLRAEALRARARVMAASGDLGAAEAAIGKAEAIHRSSEDRWELARTLLVAGEVHRRGRRRAVARAFLREALEIFLFLGAGLWAKRAREELGRIGAPREEGGLTATQRRVAELVADGLTNRQAADRLSMSSHTVEAHLSEIYRKLEIRSRSQLRSALGVPTDPRRATARDSIRQSAAQLRDKPPS